MFEWLTNKLNPAQPEIVADFGDSLLPAQNLENNKAAYDKVEVVSRGVDIIVDSAADIRVDIGSKLDEYSSTVRVRPKKLGNLVNFRPNPFINADVFKRNIFIDLLLEGDAFIYHDGDSLFNLPALNVEIITDKVTYIKEYKYANKSFKPNEIIHIKDNSAKSIYTGTSRLDSALNSIKLILAMNDFQTNFFENSAIPGIILTTPNPLSERVKNRILANWTTRFNPRTGGKRPMIIDGEFKIESLSKYNFKELDFNDSIKVQEDKVLKALGVPPVLLDSGNNANINPNLRMFYIQTVLPLYSKYVQALEHFFGYDMKAITQDVLALAPELRDLANFHSTLVNGGIYTRNESRKELRKPEFTSEDATKGEQNMADDLILPANIAGSAVNATEGGAPKKEVTDG